MTIQNQLHILVSPLDWGLGHTTRCVPLIACIISIGHRVTFAGNDWQISYIKETFPDMETVYLEGYNVHYSRSGSGFMLSILFQLRGLFSRIRKEHEWLLELTASQRFDAIISDNRYGLYHPRIPSVIITHQLLAKSGLGGFADRVLRKYHYKLLNRFSQCWVADVEGRPNLSGTLGHPATLPRQCRYIGLLSQVMRGQTSEEHLLILLSGPEPQRSILSAILWQEVQQYNGKVVFVEGSKNVAQPPSIPRHITYHTRVTKDTLEPLIRNASMVICRSGYSTLMDLCVLNKKAILIPTPGQTEQEYLGRHLHSEGVYYCAAQRGFNLLENMRKAASFPFVPLNLQHAQNEHRSVLRSWLAGL